MPEGSARPIKILHLISTLDVGGAEQDLLKLVDSLDKGAFQSVVATMTTIGPVGRDLLGKGYPVACLGMRKGIPDPRGVFRLLRLVGKEDPDLVHCWMYHANLLGLLAAGRRPLAWGILCSDMDLSRYGPVYRFTVKLGALLSGLPSAVVANSLSGRSHHQDLGYRPKRFEVIPNGFDTERFKPDPSSRREVRKELTIPDQAPVIGMISRLDPMKDHETFFKAAGLLAPSHPEAHFVLAGRGTSFESLKRAGLLRALTDPGRFRFLDERRDIPRVLNAFDIACSSSVSEGLPNAVGEAMATGVPAVVTDAGDSGALVGDTGFTVPKQDPDALCRAWESLLDAGQDRRKGLGELARKRILERYSLHAMTGKYETLYKSLTSGPER